MLANSAVSNKHNPQDKQHWLDILLNLTKLKL